MTESNPLSILSASIADGDAIDWDEVRALAGDDDIQQLLEHLRVVAGVAEVHRTQFAETLAATPEPPAAPAIGIPEGPQRWGHLILVRKIGEGAFGEVYEALDTWLDHPRALKLLRPEVANRTSAPQILHEARKLVRVRHPNVVMVHGADSHDGRVGFWMDLIEGQTLEQRVREGRLSAGEAAYIGKELCRALAAVHQANIVHRDVKAQNVMRASDGGRIILMDFGAGEFFNATAPGRPHGTPLYLAPELITGGAATVQSDIYALGVLLFYLVTGRFPVEGASLTDLALAHAQRARRHLRDARPDLPDSFVSVVERAIDREPARRFQSAGDFHAALEERDTATATTTPTPLLQTPIPAPAPPHSEVSSLLKTLVAGLGGLLTILILGAISCRTFEVVMNVRPQFLAGPADYLVLGYKALLPFVLEWLVFIAVLLLLAGVRSLLGRRLDRLIGPVERFFERTSPITVATLIPMLGTVWWVIEAWRHWLIVTSLGAIHLGQPLNPPKVPILDGAFADHQYGYSQFATVLSFIVLFAVWRWWPSLERRAADVGAVRRMKYASLVLVGAVMISAVMPRRFAMERFPVVLYKKQQSYVIATRGPELLLYVGDSIDKVRPIVTTDDEDFKDLNLLLNLTGR